MTDDDPELGPVRWCKGCQEWWPDDAEFWSVEVRGDRKIFRCRACRLETAVQYRKRRVVVLGPCRCQGCGRLVRYGPRITGTRRISRWRETNGVIHNCGRTLRKLVDTRLEQGA